jgi:two-component system LytT family response regulator
MDIQEESLYMVILTSIVDHDVASRGRVLDILSGDPAIRVMGVFTSAAEAEARSGRLAAQLLILNSHLPDRDSFDLLRVLTDQGVSPHVIFIAGGGDRSMDAFAVGAIDYLVRPFDPERFARAVGRAKVLVMHAQEPGPAVMGAPTTERTRLVLSERGKVVLLQMRDIEFIQADGTHIRIYAAGQCYQRRQSLTDIEKSLDATRFVRVHRSTVVNIEHIAEMHPLFHGDYELILRRGTRLTLSRRYRARLRPFLLD